MKIKYIAFSAAFFVSIALTSCNDWLYLEPEDGVIRQDFWQTKEDVNAAVIGTYCSLLGNTESGYYAIPELVFTWGEIRGDMVGLGSRSRSEYTYIKSGDILPSSRIFRWNAFYRTINNCNTILEFSGDVLDLDASFTEEQLLGYQSEAYALRAMMYFYLYRSFGDVPMKLSATTHDGEEFTLQKVPKEQVLDQIIKDLLFAYDHVVYTHGDAITDKGRITKFTVAAMLADAYMWKEDYETAVFYCDIIINSGKYALVLNDQSWFTNLYVEGNSVEGIFEIQFDRDILNPYYSLYSDNRYLKANPGTMEDLFPLDPLAEPDSADIRADGCSFKSSDNYSFWKYVGLNDEEARERDQSYANFIVYRYAEILLFKAEAMNQLGSTDEAMQLVNIIRSRANAQRTTKFIGGSTSINDVDRYILEERTREFAFEGKRWYDVLRFGRKNNYSNKDLIVNMIMNSAPPEKLQTITNKYRDTLFHYFPIHEGELEANVNLEQNPYYKGL